MKREKGKYDVIVAGGGLAGICAAIAAARHGCSVALIQDRPVLGGNSSSEIRVNVGGASHSFRNARETGIIEELLIEDRYRNPFPMVNAHISSIWDMILWEWVTKEEKLDLYLNTSARKALMDGNRIVGVRAFQLGTEREFEFRAKIVVDATGDGAVAFDAGADYRMGREARDEFNESLAPEKADNYTLGSSIMFRARDMGRPVEFEPPPWAYDFPTDEDLPFRNHGRISGGFWWIEFGGMLDTIEDNERIRDELWKLVFGVWDHIKNHGDHGAENYALEWVGFIPGKRESRRFMGDYILTQNDVEEAVLFEDRIAYGGWPIDLHPPKGIYESGKPAVLHKLKQPYSIPYRCIYSRNVENLMMAGRNISVTHVALGTTRLMATCAVIGQAAGTAAYLCKRYDTTPRGIYEGHIHELQQLLLKDDCYIIEMRNEDPDDLARGAKVRASSHMGPKYSPENVINGISRPVGDEMNMWASDPTMGVPQEIELEFENPAPVNAIYLTFDTNLDKLVESGPAPECVRDYELSFFDGERWRHLVKVSGNYHRRRIHRFETVRISKLRLRITKTNSDRSARVYEIRCYNERSYFP
ncbi:FAD-dependent oxidoreductase [Candidatus Poribacteria bacterium]|nr:FAD-dependent oxidoreductase [Candidatus Poribacteria bacterium]